MACSAAEGRRPVLAGLGLAAVLVTTAGGAAQPSAARGAVDRQPAAGAPAVTIWHLGHSGVAVEIGRRVLIFDYADDRPVDGGERGFDSGVVDPGDLAGREVVVFISHEHHDHFWPDAIAWLEGVPGLRFVVSPEVARADRRFAVRRGVIDVVGPDADRRVGDLRVETLRSTDSGVAFLVEVDGLTIYHSGDHAAWNWDRGEGVPARFVDDLLRPLDGRTIDIAFQVSDPRFHDAGWGGAVAFAERLQPRLLVPIHMNGDYSKMGRLAGELRQSSFGGDFWQVRRRGESRRFPARQATPTGDG